MRGRASVWRHVALLNFSQKKPSQAAKLFECKGDMSLYYAHYLQCLGRSVKTAFDFCAPFCQKTRPDFLFLQGFLFVSTPNHQERPKIDFCNFLAKEQVRKAFLNFIFVTLLSFRATIDFFALSREGALLCIHRLLLQVV